MGGEVPSAPPAAREPGRRLPVDRLDGVIRALAPPPLTVTVVRAPEDLEPLRETWLELRGDCLAADPDYFHWAVYNEPHVLRPHVLLVEGGGAPPTLVAARIKTVRLPCKLGSRTLYAPKVRAISIPRGCILGHVDPERAAMILAELQAALRRGEADAIVFRQLEHGSVVHRQLLAQARLGERREHTARTNLRWQVDVARDDYVASLSPSTRKAARRTASRLEEQFGERLSIDFHRDAADVEACLDAVEAVAARTYQRRLGVGYVGDELQRSRLETIARHGWFRAAVLRLDGRPIAFELGELYGGRFNSIAGGYDPDYGSLRVGAHLLLTMIAAQAEDADVSTFDFGFGDAPYKSKLAHRAVVEGDFTVYARRLRPRAVSLARTAVLELSRMVTSALDRASLLERIRRRTRRPAADAHAGTLSTG